MKSNMTAESQKVGYIRVSTKAQCFERQLEAMKEAGITKVFSEKKSARKPWKQRDQLVNMIDYIRKGDEVYILSIDRLGRNVMEFFVILDEIVRKGAKIQCLGTGKSYPADNLSDKVMMALLAIIAEVENDMRRTAVIQGQKASDRSKWRKRGLSAFTEEEVKLFAKHWFDNDQLPKAQRLTFVRLNARFFAKNGPCPKEKIPHVNNLKIRARPFYNILGANHGN